MTKFTHITIDGIAYIVSENSPNANELCVDFTDNPMVIRRSGLNLRDETFLPNTNGAALQKNIRQVVAQSSPVYDGLKLFRVDETNEKYNEAIFNTTFHVKNQKDVAFLEGFTEGRKGMFTREEMLGIAGNMAAAALYEKNIDILRKEANDYIDSISTFPVELLEENEVIVFRRKA
jgi:hypothetical protein